MCPFLNQLIVSIYLLNPKFSYAFIATNKLSTTTTLTSNQYKLNNKSHHACVFTKLLLLKEATFGMGCFWKPSEELLKVNGVIDTTVAYAGDEMSSKTIPPSYDSVCYGNNWVEAVRVQYDDSVVSYNQLLDSFFETQEPKVGSGRQYASIIFAHDDEQNKIANEWLSVSKNRKDGLPSSITKIEPLGNVWKAEGYHQEYWQKLRPRAIGFVLLICVTNGAIDQFVINSMNLSLLHSVANGIAIAGCAYVLLERVVDKKVVRL